MTEEEPTELRVLQRIVFPIRGDLDVVPLYVETNLERGAAEAAAEQLRAARTGTGRDDSADAEMPGAAVETQSAITFSATARGMGDLAGRRDAAISAGSRVSFGTYFNAFPAGYWRRWTVIDNVILRLRVVGECNVIVYRTTAKGHSYPVQSRHLEDGDNDLQLTLALDQFVDGGWYWFDIAAGPKDVQLQYAEWVTRTDRTASGRLSIGITTFNRPEMCVRGLAVLADATDVRAMIDRIYVVDQGTQRVSDHPDYAEAVKPIQDQVKLIQQGNLGGSGGFARAMDETATAGDSDYVLLLDDDVVTEPESILRAVTFADLARRPTIVGGHMFSLYDRTVLHALGESVAPYSWWWGAAPHTRQSHDFGRRNLRNTPWLHRRVDVDYNGWWMCLIPTSVVRELGLALPVFIKWDDAEYGLRAKEAGFPTVSLPGVAVWHIPWQDKNDALDWQAYYHLRNRLIAALLHSPYPRGGSIVSENFEFQVRHLLAMQYSTAKLRIMAIEDVLAGPEHLHRDLPTKLGELRALRADYPDARTQPDPELFPPVKRTKLPKRGKEPQAPSNPATLVLRAALGAVRQLLPVKENARAHPEMSVANQYAEWWMLASVDGALVSTADGTGTSWYQRDPERFKELMRTSVALHTRLAREWPQLAKRYRSAAVDFTSAQQWRETFEASTNPTT